ncbi:MAG: FG-GAP repeat domain-containing protein [Planctomycetota bacterium]
MINIKSFSVSAAAIVILTLGNVSAQTFTNAAPNFFPSHYGDVNRDGAVDMVGVYFDTTPYLLSLLGDGAAHFVPGPASPLQLAPSGLVLLDTNGDAALDCVTSYYSNLKKIANKLGDATGAFGSESYYFTFENYQTAIVAADGNNDGIADCYIMNNDSEEASEMHGVGDGTFFGSPTYATGLFPCGAVITDLDGDGLADKAFISEPKINIYHSNSPNKILTITQLANTGGGADVNGDGNTDLIYGSLFSSKVGLFYNLGMGNYGIERIYPIPTGVAALAYGDLNLDGQLDILASGAGGIFVLKGSASGLLPAASIAPTAATSLQIVDFDSDGFPDVGASFGIFINNSTAPDGTMIYGSGTAGCYGAAALGANSEPAVGNLSFAFTCTNAPKNSGGFGMVSEVQDLPGTAYFDILFHIDPFAPLVHAFDTFSDAAGISTTPAPIPNDPLFHGKKYYAQELWLESTSTGATCGPSSLKVISTSGLTLIIP